MGMFDYKSYTATESVELMETAYRLATYSSLTGVFGLPTREVFQWLGDNVLSSGLYPSTINLSLPDGWRELTPTNLSLPAVL